MPCNCFLTFKLFYDIGYIYVCVMYTWLLSCTVYGLWYLEVYGICFSDVSFDVWAN